MALEINKRLPAVPSLSKILPSGTEGGKEFSRIINLLLFNDAKKQGIEYSLFDDAAGDFEGLDGYSRKNKSKDVIGYQYKFFPSPLSDAHRAEISKSLTNALERTDQLRLKKWILVTPDDLKNSARRKNGGDVSWFESLRSSNAEIEIEHFGHSKIIALFLQAQNLCLYYYPSLIATGIEQQKTIQECRAQYDDNMRKRYGRIEFVGMSVYKEEASRRIPLEKIYIPLSVVAERAPEETEDTPRINPLIFLKPGSKNIILGDPGSGKSTLVGFLALAGINKELQTRCNTEEDSRLTIVITLRRYADELKARRNLPLLEYILEVAQADFNMNGLKESFFSYYIESGQAILLFDGLDELPTKEFKSLIRNRIDSFTESFPTNTVIVTSRLVGYEAEIRFDDSYGHYRVAKLKVSEIEKFINDWYTARIDDSVEKSRNAADLIKIIKQPDSDSIRELARNPLLLTIVALVHRIDAVLPDQRVVLYQKCTETLLNTWYKAKRQDEEAVKGRIERRNRLRVEAIAYWMHRSSLKGKARSVAPRDELIRFLTDYISKNETIRPQDDLAEDQAESFVDFIKNSAGLLIEAGDGLYSFIHLTFQEYLCATHLAAFGERDGTASIWRELRGDLPNPRWREVARLLVASLRSTQAQTYFVEKLLNEVTEAKTRDTCLLLLGLLRDAIEPAETHSDQIIKNCFETLLKLEKGSDASAILYSILHWLIKDTINPTSCDSVWQELYYLVPLEDRIKMHLINAALALPTSAEKLGKLPSPPDSPEWDLAQLIILGKRSNTTDLISQKLFSLSIYWAFHSPGTNAEASILFTSSLVLDSKDSAERLFSKELALLGIPGYGPHGDSGLNMVSIAAGIVEDLPENIDRALTNYLSTNIRKDPDTSGIKRCIEEFTQGKLITLPSQQKATRAALRARAKKAGSPVKLLRPHNDRETTEIVQLIRAEFLNKRETAPKSYWSLLKASDIFSVNFLRSLEGCSDIKMSGIWSEALHSTLADQIPLSIAKYYSKKEQIRIQEKILEPNPDRETIYFAAWIILFDLWAWTMHTYENPSSSPIKNFIAQLKKTQAWELAPIKLSIYIHEVTLNPTSRNRKNLVQYWTSTPEVRDMLSAAGWGLHRPENHQIPNAKKQV